MDGEALGVIQTCACLELSKAEFGLNLVTRAEVSRRLDVLCSWRPGDRGEIEVVEVQTDCLLNRNYL